MVAVNVILYWVDATRPVILALVPAPLIPVTITVEPLAGTAVALYDVTVTPLLRGGCVNDILMELVVYDTKVRLVGGINVVWVVILLDATELPVEPFEYKLIV